MYNLPSLWITFAVFALSLGAGHISADRSADELSTSSGQYSVYRIDDSTRLMYGKFTITSNSGQTQISAHRLRVGIGRTNISNSFRNDLLDGNAFTDGVDIHTNALIWTDILHSSADRVEYSKDSSTIQLRGSAIVHGDDVKITSPRITVFLSEGLHVGR